MNLRSWQTFGSLVSQINTQEKIIALTFDDGPTNNTNKILEMLQKDKIKATFFVTGQGLIENPNLGREITAGGHELGNHSFSHQRMIFKSPSFIKSEIQKTDDLIKQTGFHEKIYFRPPFGKKLFILPWLLMKMNKTTIMWNLEPDSFKDIAQDPNKISSYVTQNIKPGSIILLHPMYNQADLEAIPMITKPLLEQGYKFVTINELLKY